MNWVNNEWIKEYWLDSFYYTLALIWSYFHSLVRYRFFKKMVPGRTNSQGLKITEENVLPFYNVKKWIDILVFSVGPVSRFY